MFRRCLVDNRIVVPDHFTIRSRVERRPVTNAVLGRYLGRGVRLNQDLSGNA
jgi:hypothetical protein